MENQEVLLKLFKDLTPLKRSIVREFNLTHLGLEKEDIMGFLDDKIIHVFLKYPDKPYEELKGICISSLYRVIPRLIRKYGREVLTEPEEFVNTQEEVHLSIAQLLENLLPLLDPLQGELAQVILDPPAFIVSQVKNQFSKVPARLILEFLGIPINKYNLRKVNTFRRSLYSFIRKNFNPETLEYMGA